VKRFKAPKKSLGTLDAETAATLIAATADVALVIDRKGIIRDVATGSDELAAEIESRWVGQSWAETVSNDSRTKIESLLREAAQKATPRWRQVNHPLGQGANLPVVYSAVQVGSDGRIVAVGRDLRVVAALQQRLLDAEQSIERDYSRLRHAETKYRLLFQLSSESVLVLDATTLKVTEANPAAVALFGAHSRRIIGRSFTEGFDATSTQALQVMLAAVRTAGRADDQRVRILEGGREYLASASVFRQENASFFLVRLSAISAEAGAAVISKARSRLLDVVESSPDGLVVTDTQGHILVANRSFLDLAQLATEEQARGESLDRWLGRPGADLNVLTANVRQHGSVRLFATTVRGEYGSNADVEISAVSVLEGGQPCYGFAIRNVERRSSSETRTIRELPRSVEQLTELVGRVALKDLVRETTDVIERLCIEAALELTGDNRASTAEILGLSRQSLYVKLRRYGLGDLSNASETGQTT
jgi:transcriptional regulator PpsR